MQNPNYYSPHGNLSFPRNVFERRIFCGICGGMMLRTSLRRHSPERAIYCPVCQKNPETPGYNFRYPLYDLIWETYKILRKERRTAIRTAQKVRDAHENGKVAMVDQFYKRKMEPLIEKFQSNTEKINQIFLDTPVDEPFSLENAKYYLSLQNQATLLTDKLAAHAETLLDFYASLNLDNQWYLLFGQLPEDFILTAELSRKTISTIVLTPEQPPKFNLKRQEERTLLLNGLNHIFKIEQRIARKEHYSNDE